MSNRVTIVATKFINLDEEEDPNGVTYGFRAFDDLEMTYCNAMSESDARQSDLELLRDITARYIDRPLEAMFDFITANRRGIEINGTYYEWKEVEDILQGE
jgi:hypothetical protein